MKGCLVALFSLWPLLTVANPSAVHQNSREIYSSQQGCMGCHQGGAMDEEESFELSEANDQHADAQNG
jgi:hypothetical protein